jgi:hypothetical protein
MEDSYAVQKTLILKHIDVKCKILAAQLTGNYQAQTLIRLFKYPNATYLTARMFR